MDANASTSSSFDYKTAVLRGVESLLDDHGVSKECLVAACLYLDVSSFSDVAEERFLVKICGYPLCSSPLLRILNQTYVIRGRRVYDNTERKKFCSDLCYERFRFLIEQLPDEPAWIRGAPDGTIRRTNITFLEDTADADKRRGLPGREIELFVDKLPDSIKALKLSDKQMPTNSEADVSNIFGPRKAIVGGLTEKAVAGSAYAVAESKKDSCPNALEHASFEDYVALDSDDDSEQEFSGSDDEGNIKQYHIDSEQSALGRWTPANKQNKVVEKLNQIARAKSTGDGGLPRPSKPGGIKIIDALPLAVKKRPSSTGKKSEI